MWKTLSLNTVTHKGFLVPVYFVLGTTLVPLNTLIPEVRDVQNATFNECHKSCHVERGIEYCTRVCSGNSSIKKTVEPVKSKAAIPRGSTGPTVPPKPVGTQGHKH